MKLPVIYVMTHDSIFVGEDGPTHQPVEHLAVARAIPNMVVLRPGDAEESNLAWILAMDRTNGPVVLSLTRQNLPVYEKPAHWEKDALQGAYILYRGSDKPDICLVATGSEVHLALEAAKRYESTNPGKTVRVVSMISREIFMSQDKTWRQATIPPGCRTIVVEIASSIGWEGFVQDREDLFTLDSFGMSGPGSEVAEHFGLDLHGLVARMERI
jgi:transketolase